MYNYVKRYNNRQVTYMKPRIFLSSTFYDLKYIREDLANFVRAHDYEPILFENGDIGYTPGKSLDKSCYEAMKTSDMVILIIGGEYGSAATGETKDKFDEYMSITRKEFRTAIDNGIPVFVMIDKRVMAEYCVYEANYEKIEEKREEIKFVSTKNINIFRFIKEIKNMPVLPIQEFEKSTDIKEFIGKQWADMFKNYLSMLKSEREDNKIEGSVNELKILIEKMNLMVDRVGKTVLSKDNSKEYEDVVNQQEILSFCDALVSCFHLDGSSTIENKSDRESFVVIFLNVLKKFNFNSDNNDSGRDNDQYNTSMVEIFRELNSNGFKVRSIRERDYTVLEKFNLLDNQENMNRIIGIMTEDKYFNKFYYCDKE